VICAKGAAHLVRQRRTTLALRVCQRKKNKKGSRRAVKGYWSPPVHQSSVSLAVGMVIKRDKDAIPLMLGGRGNFIITFLIKVFEIGGLG
jgi:hypothetical protein